MVSTSGVTAPGRPDFLFLGAHAAIDFANTFVPPPGPGTEFLQTWQDVIEWLKETKLSDGQNLAVSESTVAEALGRVRHLRQQWKATLEELRARRRVDQQFVQELNAILSVEMFSETLVAKGKRSFLLRRSASLVKGKSLALGILARSIAEFLTTAEFKYLRRCANTDSCALIFYDTTKNHRRQWCSNSMCGNRYKVAEFRRRERASRRR